MWAARRSARTGWSGNRASTARRSRPWVPRPPGWAGTRRPSSRAGCPDRPGTGSSSSSWGGPPVSTPSERGPPPYADAVTVPSAPPGRRRRVAVLTHMGRPTAIAAATRLIQGLLQAGITSVLPPGDADCLPAALAEAVVPLEPPGRLSPDVELMVVLGGDGTILRPTEWVLTADVPLLGVNLGHVGFLAEAESSEIDSIVTHVVNRSYTVEERFTIDVTLRDSKTFQPAWSSYAINEVSIEKAARERMLEVLVEVDGRPLSRWACDGMLVSTPTGSTAYAFSAGGPVVWPGVDAMLVLPLSAHALFARPLVLSPTSTVIVEVVDVSQTHGVVWCDGRRSVELLAGMEIIVTRGKQRLRLARLSQAPFTDRLVQKFGLRVEGWRGSADP